MADENLTVTISMRDDLSRQVTEATKSINKLGREMDEARRAAEKTGDFSQFDRLKKTYDDERIALSNLKRERDEAARKVRAMSKETVQAAGKMQSAWKRLQNVFKNPLFTAATIAGVTLFGKRALEAFAQAEQSQLKLVEAYRKFDAVRDVPIESIRALASELQSLTGTDDDLLAAAAGTLARFDLTGEAIQRVLPLVNDYAIATGRNVVDASELIGKALMGNARALKELGINFVATGDRGKDLETVLAALDSKVGGTGEAFGETAQGGLTRAQAAFGDLQEEVGGTLVPALTGLLKIVEPLTNVFRGMPDPIKGVTIAIGFLAAATLAIGPRLATMVVGMRAAGVEATVMRGKMSAAAGFLTGPWGAALAAGTIALGYFLSEQAEAGARVDQFAESIDAATGKLNQAGVTKVAETLMSDISPEDWKTLEQYGFTVEGVTAAVIGGEDAWAAFKDQKAAAVGRAAIGSDKELLAILEGNAMGLRSEVEKGTRAWEVSKRAMEIAADVADDTDDSLGGVRMQLVDTTRAQWVYRDAMYSSSAAAAALKVAQDGATTAASNLTSGLQGVADEVARQEAYNAYKTALDNFIANPTEEAALAVSTAMTNAANAIKDPGEQAKFTKTAVDDIRKAADDAGMKLNPALDESLRRARGQAVLLDRQIDRAVRARSVDVALRFSDSRATYGGDPDGQRGDGNRHGGWIGGNGGPTSDVVPTWLSRGEFVLRGGAAAALRAAVGDAGMWQLNHADRSMPSFLGAAVPAITTGNAEPALVGAGAPVINIGEIKADSGVDVQAEVMWALRRADRIKRERG